MSQKYTLQTPAAKQVLLDQSSIEVNEMEMRSIHCPRCGFTIGKVYSDAIGHLQMKCGKCKLTAAINLRYFQKRLKFRGFRIIDK